MVSGDVNASNVIIEKILSLAGGGKRGKPPALMSRGFV